MAGQNFIRVAALALCLSTLSFAAGVAGDLSIIDPPRSGQRVVLRIPPELPADTVRAGPLPSLISTASAAEPEAVEPVFHRFSPERAGVEQASHPQKPEVRIEIQLARVTPKAAQMAALAAHERKVA